MKKTLFTAALSFALTVFGLTSYAQVNVTSENDQTTFTANASENLYLKILPKAAKSSLALNFAIKRNGGAEPDALLEKEQIEPASAKNVKGLRLSLGEFKEGETFQLGVISSNGFEPFISSEPGYYTSVDEKSFYSLDFSENPFDGLTEIYVMGEPLPAPTVTLIVALAAGAAFLLYRNRKQRASCAEQA